MRGLTIIVAEASAERLRTGLAIATAQVALGGRIRLFLHEAAVAALAAPATEDGRLAAAGLPSTSDLIDDLFALGGTLILCQSGLHLAGLTAADLDPRCEYGGLVSLLQALGEDRLLAV